MKLDPELEKKLKSKALEYLKKGKPNWDIPHTLAAVYWMRKLIEKEGGNERILVTTMYLHDIGYYGLFPKKGYKFEEVMASKPAHAKRGAEASEKILKQLKYTPSEIKQITHLVRIHDELDKLSTRNEILVMEADCLAQIDTKRVKPNIDKENHLKFIEHFEKDRIPRFRTKTGKKFLKKLFKKTKNYFN
jgi:HD superfamily phosphodiesterase